MSEMFKLFSSSNCNFLLQNLKSFRDVKLHVFKCELFRNGACNPKK